MSENDFYLLNGNRYRGSRYANFAGGGIDPQGNVSSAANENVANEIGTSTDASQQTPTSSTALSGQASPGLTSTPAVPKTPTLASTAKNLVIGSALPYAGQTIGAAAGRAIGAGASTSAALGEGVSALGNKVSAGLIGGAAGAGAGAAATNAALAARGSSFGPATASEVSQASGGAGATSGSSLLGAAGAGFGTAAATLLTGGSVKQAAEAGIGTAVGTAIGSAVAGPIGGFIGGTIGGLFCFAPDTVILMADGSVKAAGDLRLGDEVLEGGMVIARGESFADEVYRYKNAMVSGGHAVFDEGKWRRVKDVASAEKIDQKDTKNFIVAPVVTEKHILITPYFISADMIEINDGWNCTEDDRINVLNSDVNRNEHLFKIERESCHHAS